MNVTEKAEVLKEAKQKGTEYETLCGSISVIDVEMEGDYLSVVAKVSQDKLRTNRLDILNFMKNEKDILETLRKDNEAFPHSWQPFEDYLVAYLLVPTHLEKYVDRNECHCEIIIDSNEKPHFFLPHGMWLGMDSAHMFCYKVGHGAFEDLKTRLFHASLYLKSLERRVQKFTEPS